MSHHGDHKHDSSSNHHHHILEPRDGLKILLILLGLTAFTVFTAVKVDIGVLNFPLAMLIASTKAVLVCMFFMGLKYDHKENSLIFSTSLIFLGIFMVLTFSDLLTRGDVYVKGAIVPTAANAKAKFSKPWVSTPEMVAYGKEQFAVQCATCHGSEGAGNGPAAAGLNPKPRNFTVGEGWKAGRKASQIFNTLTKGLNTMPAFASIAAEDRWALAHFVRTLGPHEGEKDSDADLKSVGVDPSGDGSSMSSSEAKIPVDLAIDLISESK